ncbi:hypothetical protein BJ742DRAFT_771051 [Cladochytrium replicatum]|nr:hypothetical protein BJ742DRAFT_771051 [Cladochytrium replicatum]
MAHTSPSRASQPTDDVGGSIPILRHRLNQLDYRESFSKDSLELVQRLFADLVTTTESAKKYKNQVERLVQEKNGVEAQVEPLRSEIARFSAENNSLHHELIRLADEKDIREKKVHQATRRHEAELADLRFMNSQYLRRAETEQRRAEAERDKVGELLSQMKATGEKTASMEGKQKKTELLAQRLQKIELETGLEPLHQPFPSSLSDPAFIDLVKIAETRSQKVESEKLELVAKNNEMEGEIEILTQQLHRREQELQRIMAELDLARAQQFSTVSAASRTYLDSKGSMASDRAEFHDVNTAKQRIEQLEMQVEYLQEHIDSVEKEVTVFEEEKKELIQIFNEEKAQLESDIQLERNRGAGLMRNLTKLENMLQSLSKPKAAKAPAKKTKEQNDNEVILSQTEFLDMGKQIAKSEQEKELLYDKLKAIEEELRSTKKREPSQHSRNASQLTSVSKRDIEVQLDPDPSLAKLERSVSELSSSKEKLEDEIILLKSKVTEAEALRLDHAKCGEQLDLLRAKLSTKEGEAERLSHRLNEAEGTRLHSMAELSALNATTANTKTVGTCSAGTMTDFIAQLQPSSTIPSSNSNQGTVEALQNEVEQLRYQLKTGKSRESGGASANETFRQLDSDLRRLKLEMDVSEAKQAELENERNTGQREIERLEGLVIDRERFAHALGEKSRNLEIELEEETKRCLSEQQKVAESDQVIKRLRMECSRLESDLKEHSTKLAEQRNLLLEVDQQRDEAQAEADKQAERAFELEGSLSKLREDAIHAEREIMSLREQVDVLGHHLNEQDREVLQLRRQVDMLVGERDQLSSAVERYASETKAVSADVAALTREGQVLNSELTEAVNQRDRFRAELDECERHMQLLEEVVISKDRERDQLMGSYRKLIAEHEKLDFIVRTSSEESTNMRTEVIMRDKRLQELQSAMEDCQSQISQYKIDISAFERQNNNLTRALATSERAVRHLEADKGRLVREIGAVRDLAHSLEKAKEEVTRQFTATTVEVEKLQNAIRKLDGDNSALGNQLRAEKLKTDRLEHLIAIERTRKMETERVARDAQHNLLSKDDKFELLAKERDEEFGTLVKQLEEVTARCKILEERTRELERCLSARDSDLALLQKQYADRKRELDSVRDQLALKERLLDELYGTSTEISPRSSRIGKVDSAILETHIELQKADKRKRELELARRIQEEAEDSSIGSSDQIRSSKSTSGTGTPQSGKGTNIAGFQDNSNLLLTISQARTHFTDADPQPSQLLTL